MRNYRESTNGRSNFQGVDVNKCNVVKRFLELGISLVQYWGCSSRYALRSGENGPLFNVKKDDVSILFGEDKKAIKRCLEKYKF